MTRSVDNLQRLHDEFDIANAAASQFYIAFQFSRANDVAFDAMLDFCNLLQQVRCGVLWIDKGLMQPQEIVRQLAAAGDSASFDEGDALPGFAKSSIVIFHAFERASQRSSRAFGSQTQVNSEERAGWMRCRKRL